VSKWRKSVDRTPGTPGFELTGHNVGHRWNSPRQKLPGTRIDVVGCHIFGPGNEYRIQLDLTVTDLVKGKVGYDLDAVSDFDGGKGWAGVVRGDGMGGWVRGKGTFGG
jgi:hypothetical protein